jgi:hypothetical protein
MEGSRREVEKAIEQHVEERVTVWVTILVQVAVSFVLAVVIFKFVWAWVISDLFPGAVAQGLISGELTWLAALKLAVLVSVLSGLYPTLMDASKRRL